MSKVRVGRPKKNREALSRFFQGMKVVEAKNTLVIIVNDQDIASAKVKDPACAYTQQACKRLFQSQAVVFLKTFAYVDLPNKNGIREVNRFQLTPAVRKQIEIFDRTGLAAPGGFHLRPPLPSDRLANRVEADRAYKVKHRAKIAERKKQSKISKPRAKRVSPYIFEGGDVRNGRGTVHFIKNSKKTALPDANSSKNAKPENG